MQKTRINPNFRSRFILICFYTQEMVGKDKLPKIADVDRESRYGYVFGVSGPGIHDVFFSAND